MTNIIKIKRSETTNSIPTINDLAVGELCMNIADQKLYTRKSDDSIVTVSDAVVGKTTLELISDDAFTYLAKKYIAANPATSLDLNNYGLEFPEFLKTLAEINKAPYLPEFALSELYLAKAEDFKLNKLRANINLANIDLEKIKISLNPGSYLLKTKCDIYSIHQLTNKKSTKEIKQQQNQYFSIIYSSRDAVAIGNLSNDEYHILNNIKNNKPQNLTKKQILKLEDFLTIKFEI